MKRRMICFVVMAALVAVVGGPAEVRASTLEEDIATMMDDMNAVLAAAGANYRAVMVEYLTGDVQAQGNTVVSSDVGNKRSEFDFVPFDTRRFWGDGGGGITYAIDTTGDAEPLGGSLTQSDTDAAIERAIDSWNAVSCSVLPLIRKNGLNGTPIGTCEGQSFGQADITYAGFRGLEFGGDVRAATVTFGFCEPCTPTEVFTDVDNNGRFDAAFREIYFDPFEGVFGAVRVWVDDEFNTTDTDVESVALHETGHGLSQEHFGQVFEDSSGELQFAPRAVMNALYGGPLRMLHSADVGGHCANWGNWPVN